MTDGLPDDGSEGDDLVPLTLREKVRNRAFNKALDRRLNFYTAIMLGLIGVGAVREVFQFFDGEAFTLWVFLVSLSVGLGVFEIIAYVGKRQTRRED